MTKDYQHLMCTEINVLTLQEGVRKRPAMYFGSRNFAPTAYNVLLSFLYYAKGPAKVRLLTGGRCNIEMPGAFPLEEAEAFMTKLVKDKPPVPMVEPCFANAVCSDLDLIIITPEGERYFQYYSRGLPTSKLGRSKLSLEAEPDTTIIKFRIDPEVIVKGDFESDFEMPGTVYAISHFSNVEVTVIDTKTSKTVLV